MRHAPDPSRLAAVLAAGTRATTWLVTALLFAVVVIPLGVVHRLLRPRRRAGWTRPHPPRAARSYLRPW
jgi:hypothetical protein